MDFHSGDSAKVRINKDEIKLTRVATFQNLSVTNFFFNCRHLLHACIYSSVNWWSFSESRDLWSVIKSLKNLIVFQNIIYILRVLYNTWKNWPYLLNSFIFVTDWGLVYYNFWGRSYWVLQFVLIQISK